MTEKECLCTKKIKLYFLAYVVRTVQKLYIVYVIQSGSCESCIYTERNAFFGIKICHIDIE